MMAFAIVNIAILALAAVAAATVLDLSWWVFLLVSPVLWWTSAVHADAFLYALLVAGFALAARGSPLAPIPIGIAAAQNPGLLPLTLLLSLYAVLKGDVRRPALLACTVLAVSVAAIHPAYYFHTLARPTALIAPDGLRLPGLQLLTYVLIDSNVGVIVQFPFLLVMMGVVVMRGVRRDTGAVVLGLSSVLAVLLAAAQVGNVNHGGTPSMSRYALWLLPPWIPALCSNGVRPRGSIARASLGACSAAWCLSFFNPSIPENTLRPTRTAMFVWTHYPSLENPLPQIFSERLRHSLSIRPAATPNCEKALLYRGHWPEGCRRTLVPDVCSRPGSWCYANRTGEYAYAFSSTFRDGKYLPARKAVRLLSSAP